MQRDDVDLDERRADGSTEQVRQVAPRALASDDPCGSPQLRRTARCSSRIALRSHTSSSLSAAADCCTSMSIVSSGDCLARPACGAQAITTGPRVHDFRHRFAIRTLLGWYREGTDVEQQLPVLSTYLGHACVRDTYWYLSACPELMQEAARRLDRRWEGKP